MYTFLLFIIFCACYLWYYTSSKIKTNSTLTFVQRLVQNKTTARYIATALLAVAYGMDIYLQGLLSGTLAFVAYVMGFFALIVLLAPYKYLQIKQVGFLLVIGLALEFLVF